MSQVVSPKIAVIGAGISGIGVANELIKHGFTNVTIFEALDRIGGRIATQYFESTGESADRNVCIMERQSEITNASIRVVVFSSY